MLGITSVLGPSQDRCLTDLGKEPYQEFLTLLIKAANSLPLRLFAALVLGLGISGIQGLHLGLFCWLGLVLGSYWVITSSSIYAQCYGGNK